MRRNKSHYGVLAMLLLALLAMAGPGSTARGSSNAASAMVKGTVTAEEGRTSGFDNTEPSATHPMLVIAVTQRGCVGPNCRNLAGCTGANCRN
jgi:hypothetical protein